MEYINKIFHDNCLVGLKNIPDKSIHCSVTSPPYYGLRDYGTDEQIGLESTPQEYISKLLSVFKEVHRVLRDDGTLWINIGDSYAGSGHGHKEEQSGKQATNRGTRFLYSTPSFVLPNGMKPKDLMGIPWALAFALRDYGWYLRQDIIWHKPNSMPESVRDRCTKNHEYIFLLSKSTNYYYDAEAISEYCVPETEKRSKYIYNFCKKGYVGLDGREPIPKYQEYKDKRNKRSVWTVATHCETMAHFACFPESLIIDCIRAGCPGNGIVLDPFIGSGTTAVVARKLNRNYVGFEINSDYIEIAERKLHRELGMFSEPPQPVLPQSFQPDLF